MPKDGTKPPPSLVRMSGKKTNQSNRSAKRKKRPHKSTTQANRPSRDSTWLKTFLISILAGFISLVVVLQLSASTGMMNAILRTELRALVDRSDRPTRLLSQGQPTWDQFAARLKVVLANDPNVKRHDAVNQLQTLLTKEPSDPDLSLLVQQLPTVLEADGDNLVTGLTAAFLYQKHREQSTPDSDALSRYKSVKDWIMRNGASRRTRLYKKEYSAAWHSALEPFIHREDVRMNLSIRMPSQYSSTYDDHFGGLPILCDELRRLSQALHQEGHTVEAVQCEQWLTRLTLGLLEHETDAPTQLLCARLLLGARGSNSAVAPIRKLVESYHQHADSAPRDLTDQSFVSLGEAAVDPEKYLNAFGGLVIVALLCCLAAGCLLLLIFLTPFAMLTGKTVEPGSTQVTKLRWYGKWLALLLPSLLPCGILATRANGAFYSVIWIILAFVVTLFLGALYTIVCAGFFEKAKHETHRWRTIGTTVFPLLLLVLLVLSPAFVTSIYRKLDLLIGSLVILVPTFITMVVACILIGSARLRTIASTAALAWCVNISAALAVLQYHRWADLRHQKAVVELCKDEFAARLGDDWREKYLTPVRNALKLETP